MALTLIRDPGLMHWANLTWRRFAILSRHKDQLREQNLNTDRNTDRHTHEHTQTYTTVLSHFYRSSEAPARTELLLVGPQVEGDVGAGHGDARQAVLEKVT